MGDIDLHLQGNLGPNMAEFDEFRLKYTITKYSLDDSQLTLSLNTPNEVLTDFDSLEPTIWEFNEY